MNATSPDVKSIFGRALEMESAAERSAFLSAACAADPALCAEVEDLLRAMEGAGDFMNRPAATGSVTIAHAPILEGPGTRIGPYKLLQQIGEGGMGVVYMAEQETPVRRKVALKIIKPGMDSAQVVARFEAERQALAVMDHTHIARVFDAGTTETGARTSSWSWSMVYRSPSSATMPSSHHASASSCSYRSARRSSTRTRRGSSTATSSRRMCS